MITGLEVSVANACLGGISSAFRLLEISHTHFWTKDFLENVQNGLHPSTCATGSGGGNSSDVSQCGSRENLDSLGSVGPGQR